MNPLLKGWLILSLYEPIRNENNIYFILLCHIRCSHKLSSVAPPNYSIIKILILFKRDLDILLKLLFKHKWRSNNRFYRCIYGL